MTNWMLTPALEIPAVYTDDRWFLRMTFANTKAKSSLETHPWFRLVEDVALPRESSDLAWKIPDRYWDSTREAIEKSATRKFKYMANKTAKCVTLAIYFANYAKKHLEDPEVSELVEFASLLSAERPFQQLKHMAYVEAGNLSLTAGEYFLNPTERWSHIAKMTKKFDIVALNGTDAVETLVIWAHACPLENGKTAVFDLADTDIKRLQVKNLHSEEEKRLRRSVVRKAVELNCQHGSAWQFALRKLKWAAIKLGLHVVILATSTVAEEEVIKMATQPNKNETKSLHEQKVKLQLSLPGAFAENASKPSEEDLNGVTMPVLISLVEENARMGSFFWRRTAFRDRKELRSDALIHNQLAAVAPGHIASLRDFRDWGLAQLGGRMNTKTEMQRALRIRKSFDEPLQAGGVTRSVMGHLVILTKHKNALVRPSWLESLSILGLGTKPVLGAFNAGPIWKIK